MFTNLSNFGAGGITDYGCIRMCQSLESLSTANTSSAYYLRARDINTRNTSLQAAPPSYHNVTDPRFIESDQTSSMVSTTFNSNLFITHNKQNNNAINNGNKTEFTSFKYDNNKKISERKKLQQHIKGKLRQALEGQNLPAPQLFFHTNVQLKKWRCYAQLLL